MLLEISGKQTATKVKHFLVFLSKNVNKTPTET